MAVKPISVSQLNNYINNILKRDPILTSATIRGEVSSVNYHHTGHVYFTISDPLSSLKCFLNKKIAENMNFIIAEGQTLILTGQISVFLKNGTYSLDVFSILPDGQGTMAIAFEKLKEELNKKGYFASDKKKPIPKYPKAIGIVTSKTGAALQDILKIINQRNQIVDIYIFPCLVQGTNASKDIAQKIRLANEKYGFLDTLIVGRGGGSQEDLWAFNEIPVAEAIYESQIPIISAVGHEIDFSISDLVADLRAETPTAAAALAVNDINQMKRDMESNISSMALILKNRVLNEENSCKLLLKEIKTNLENKLLSLERKVDNYRVIIEENNPFAILDKGYALITGEDQIPIRKIDDLAEDRIFNIYLSSGKGKFRLKKEE